VYPNRLRNKLTGLAFIGSVFVLIGCAHRELPVPDVRQATSFTCGASALQAILMYFGEEVSEDELARELGTTPNDGASPDAILRTARAHGLTAELREHVTIEALTRAVRAGTPVLLAIQAWPDTKRASFADDWEDGHYVVVVAVDGDTIVLEDPSILGSRGTLTRAELADRWHDMDNSRKYEQMGIFFGGKPPHMRAARVHLD
jgi:predicted double-glycine peptidase